MPVKKNPKSNNAEKPAKRTAPVKITEGEFEKKKKIIVTKVAKQEPKKPLTLKEVDRKIYQLDRIHSDRIFTNAQNIKMLAQGTSALKACFDKQRLQISSIKGSLSKIGKVLNELKRRDEQTNARITREAHDLDNLIVRVEHLSNRLTFFVVIAALVALLICYMIVSH